MIIAITIINKLICLENLSILIVSGDFSSFALATLSAIFPTSVCIPVLVTMAIALPVVIVVPANSIFFISLILAFLLTVHTFFGTFMLSPVKTDSLTVKL